MSSGNPEVEFTGEYLTQPGVVESFVNEERIPWVNTSYPTKEVIIRIYGIDAPLVVIDTENPDFTCILPPKGSHFGDTRRMSVLEGFVFYSPTGERRGSADMFSITKEQAQIIRERTRLALASLPKQ